MPVRGSNLARTTSALGVAARSGDADRLANARREHAAAKLESYITRVVAEAPQLSVDQRARLATLLNGGQR